MGRSVLRYADYEGQVGQFSINTIDATEGGFEDFTDRHDALLAAANGITLGNLVGHDMVATTFVLDPFAKATEAGAQKNQKARVTMIDSVTGAEETFTVPTIDDQTEALRLPHSQQFDPANAAVAAFIAAVNAIYITAGGNAATVQSIWLID